MCAGQILGVRMALLGLSASASTTRSAPTASGWLPMLRSIVAPRTPSAWSLAAGWASARSNFATGARWPQPSSILPRAAAFASLRLRIRVISRDSFIRILKSKSHQQMLAYRELSRRSAFRTERVRVPVDPSELPGYKADRVVCARCGEGVNFGRFEEVDGERCALLAPTPNCATGHPSETESQSGALEREMRSVP